MNRLLGCIYIIAKTTSLLFCCIVSNLCVYTTAMCERQKIKGKNRFRVLANIKDPLNVDSMSPLVLDSRKMALELIIFVFNNFVISIKIYGSSMSVK